MEKTRYQQQKEAWPGQTDEWHIERLANELSAKVETIHNLLFTRPLSDSDAWWIANLQALITSEIELVTSGKSNAINRMNILKWNPESEYAANEIDFKSFTMLVYVFCEMRNSADKEDLSILGKKAEALLKK